MKSKNKIIWLVMTAVMLLSMSLHEATVYAVENNVWNQALPSGVEKGELEQQIDDFVSEHTDTTAGMAVAVFDSRDTLLEKYYGYIDKENAILADKDSVFEWGSATKLLVWVSIMQLYEQGKLKLDEDICKYLPEGYLHNLSYNTPVTVLNLMNHNAGFQESYVDIMVKDAGYFKSLEEALQKHQPAQIYEPNTVTAYSNWGVALAGFIVERVSGMSFSAYVKKNIFEPLHMEHSAVAMDLSDNEWVQQKRRELQCYTIEGKLIPDCFYYISLYPAGMCTSTLADFERFAAALLREEAVLFTNEETWKEFFSPTSYFGASDIPLNCHGMWVVPFGVPAVGHGGNTAGCSCYLLLDKEDEAGVVVMTNQSGETIYNKDMMELIFGKYERLKYTTKNEIPTGIYRAARTVRHGAFKIMSLSFGNVDDKEDELWIWTNQFAEDTENSPVKDKIVYSYGDWVKIPMITFVTEAGLVLLWIIAVVFSAIYLLIKIIVSIIRKLKKIKPAKRYLKKWRVFSCLLQLAVIVCISVIAVNVSSFSMGYTYMWIFAVIGIIALIMSAMCVHALSVMRLGRQKVLDYMILGFMTVTVANVLYWNLFMFWAA